MKKAKTKKKPEKKDEKKPQMKFEPSPGDEIKPGYMDEMGQYYMDEMDFLRLQSRKERKSNCDAQAEAYRLKAELTHLKFQTEHARLLRQSAAFENAGKTHAQSIKDMTTELSKKYDINFNDPSVNIDQDYGKIIVTDPKKGLPRLRKPES